MKTRIAVPVLLVGLSFTLLACGLSQFMGPTPTASPVPATPTPTQPPATPTSAFPTYSEIIATYPAGVEMSCTDAEVSDVTPDGSWTFTAGLICPGQSQLTVQAGGTFTTGELFFGQPWKSYGAKITIKSTVTIDGKTYPAGTLLTVDKNLNWIQVSSWN